MYRQSDGVVEDRTCTDADDVAAPGLAGTEQSFVDGLCERTKPPARSHGDGRHVGDATGEQQ